MSTLGSKLTKIKINGNKNVDNIWKWVYNARESKRRCTDGTYEKRNGNYGCSVGIR
jgi:hypothetical protein